ncbi:hypothetical protein BIW11_03095 [Tropilaelaps mercedesae]|uniref:Uncharacterized protein n=1 Tax=Tropilaelaps mercedesae TaxID=418985 RepID=A0A1V9XS93_9ACAR|nr:hypothetical protein BIW11_03095 [Tropilaelaps mercedesae]
MDGCIRHDEQCTTRNFGSTATAYRKFKDKTQNGQEG